MNGLDEAAERARYRFGPRRRGGLVAGLRGGQLAVGAAALAAALLALRSLRAPFGAAAALLVLATALPAVTVPVSGRTIDGWLGVAAAFAWRRVGTERRLPLAAGGQLGVHGSAPAHRGGRPPRPFQHLSLLACEVDEGTFGAVHDRRRGTFTGALALAADGFGLLPAAERARRVAGWSAVLAAVAQQPGSLSRLAWIERTVPDSLRWLRRPDGRGATADAAASYRWLLEAESAGLLRHQLLLAATVGPERRTAPGARSAGLLGSLLSSARPLGAELAAGRLASELGRLAARCSSAGIAVDGVLGEVELGEVLRTSFAAGLPDAAGGWPWPLAVEEEWGVLRTDASWHAAYWIAEWPRSDVGDDFLLPLLVGSWARRSVAVVMTPLAPQRALRAAEQARTEEVADSELRLRHGFAVTARHRLARDAAERREQELAAGHGAYRYSGYLTVSACERSELAQSCLAVEQAAALSRLELRRLYGAQGDGFCCTLPVGRGG